MKRIAVFCGSRDGTDPVYMEAGRQLARLIAEAGLGLVYGGASVGIMGAVADAALEAGGEVFGVIPRGLQKRELAHGALTELHVVDSMHDRKQLMNELSDGFCTLPGGIGTLEELFEVVTWAALGIHAKPCCLVNTNGYYDRLLSFLNHAVTAGFLRATQRTLIMSAPDPTSALAALTTGQPLVQPKVLSASET